MTMKHWNWNGSKWIYAYFVFFAFCIALMFVSTDPNFQKSTAGLIIAFVFFFSIWCANKDFDKNRTLLKKILWIFGLWVGQSLLGVVFLLGLASLGIAPPAMIPIISQMIAGSIILYFAMVRSTTFVNRLYY